MISKVDRDLVGRKTSELNKNLKELESFRTISLKKFSTTLANQWTVFYGLQISIQLVIDIGNHILAAIGENQIEEYVDIIDKLGDRRIIPRKFAKQIRGMVGLRNILVHEYTKIDAKRIYEILQGHLKDFYSYIRYINKYLEKSSKK